MSHYSFKFSTLFKIQGDRGTIQEQRRLELLKLQKAKRNLQYDEGRTHLIKDQEESKNAVRSLQISEWMREVPSDLKEWIMVPCPKGQRCLIIARNGRTSMFAKNGAFIKTFQSMLPGDGIHRNQMTILDCIFENHQDIMYILDALVLGNQDLVNCEAAFRFFWMQSRISELDVNCVSKDNDIAFCALNYFEFQHEQQIKDGFAKYPHFNECKTKLDGFLFYHREASYTYGTTPLVGWLFSFMVADVLGFEVNPKYLLNKPSNYTNHLNFITTFEEKRSKTLSNRKCKQKHEPMEITT